MTDDSITKKVIKGLGEIGEETVKEAVKQTGMITEGVITGQELLGIKPMSDEELAKKKAEDEKKVKEEMKNLRVRNVEEEIKQVREEKEKEAEQQEKYLEQLKQQREAEAQAQPAVVMDSNQKRNAAKTQFAPGKRKKQQPGADQMSQTSEFKGGKID
jgi:hypothetical protein